MPAPPDHHVQPLIHQIHVGVAQDHLDADLRIAALEFADKGVEADQPVGHGHADPQPAPGGEGGGHDGLVGGLQAVQHGAYLAVIGHARFGDAQPPGGAVDQRNAEIGLQLVDVLADRRLGEAQVVRRRPEGAHFHHPAKDVQRRDLVHPAPVNSLLVNDGAIIAHFYHNSAVPRGVHPPSPARQRVARGRPARIMALRAWQRRRRKRGDGPRAPRPVMAGIKAGGRARASPPDDTHRLTAPCRGWGAG